MSAKQSDKPFRVDVFSFGYKYGAPTDVSLLVDIRFLPNPYWEEDMRERTGHDPEVAAYVLESDGGRGLMAKLVPLIRFMIEQNLGTEKDELRIGIGCTGGHHRSVAVVERLAGLLADAGATITVHHRDIDNE